LPNSVAEASRRCSQITARRIVMITKDSLVAKTF
jgi:hypothetical protein